MSDETEGYERPTRYQPKPSQHLVMTERERIEQRQRREELEVAERAEREARERPVREAVDKLNQVHRKLAALERQRLTDPKIPDDHFWHDPACDGLDFLTAEGISEWNVAAFRNFAQNHPEFGISDKNLQVLNNYYSKHKILLFSTSMLEKVYARMIACGIVFDAPEPERPAQPTKGTPDYTKRPRANLTVSETPLKGPQMQVGIDPSTGLERSYTAREIYLLGSEEYRRRFPTLKTISELFTAISQEREKQN
jgi:hypothetical protein